MRKTLEYLGNFVNHYLDLAQGENTPWFMVAWDTENIAHVTGSAETREQTVEMMRRCIAQWEGKDAKKDN